MNILNPGDRPIPLKKFCSRTGCPIVIEPGDKERWKLKSCPKCNAPLVLCSPHEKAELLVIAQNSVPPPDKGATITT